MTDTLTDRSGLAWGVPPVKRINAALETIAPLFFAVAEIDQDKVAAMAAHLEAGGSLPPPVVVRYGDKVMPIDGHHRLSAHSILGRGIKSWVVEGDDFEDLDLECREGDLKGRAEDYVFCNGIPALQVATDPAP